MPFVNTSQRWPLTSPIWNEVPAVYGVMDANGRIIYIGETDNIKRRMAEHLADRTHKMHLYRPVSACVEVIRTGQVARLARERALILEYDPPANHS